MTAQDVEPDSEPKVDLEILGRHAHRAIAELLRDAEALEVAAHDLERKRYPM